GAFDGVASDQVITGDLDEMIINKLKRPECNKGLLPKQLYKKAISKAIHTFVPKISWSASLAKWLGKLLFPQTSHLRFLNPLLIIATTILSIVITITLFIPEKLITLLLRVSLKWTLRPKVVEKIVVKSLDTLKKDHTLLHILNSTFYELLSDIWDRLLKA